MNPTNDNHFWMTPAACKNLAECDRLLAEIQQREKRIDADIERIDRIMRGEKL